MLKTLVDAVNRLAYNISTGRHALKHAHQCVKFHIRNTISLKVFCIVQHAVQAQHLNPLD